MALYGAETWTFRAAEQKYLESFEMWCWRRMEKISWTDHVRNEEVLLRVNEQRNILHGIRKRKANWIGHILRRNCLLKQVIEGKIKGEMEAARRRNKLICGNKMPTRCNRGFYCRSYCLLNMFRAPLCPSSGAQEYYTVVAACGISCCGFQVAGLVWS